MLILNGPPGKVHALAFAPDGRTLASTHGRAPFVFVWDLAARRRRALLGGHTHRVVALAFAPSGDLLASADSIGVLHVWDVPAQREYRAPLNTSWLGTGGHPVPLAFAPDGESLCGLGVEGWTPMLRIWDIRTGKVLHQWRRWDAVYAVAYSADGSTLAVGSRGRAVELWELPAACKRFALTQGDKVHFLAYSPDGGTLASASPCGLVKIWDAATGQKRTTLKGQGRSLHALCYAPDSRTLATASGDGTVCFWDVATGGPRGAFDWGIGAVHAVAFAPDGMRAAAGGEGQVVLWDLDDW